MKCRRFLLPIAIIAICVLGIVASLSVRRVIENDVNRPPIADEEPLQIQYSGKMLNLSANGGNAVVDFEEPSGETVRYRYKYLKANATAISVGGGVLYEKFVRSDGIRFDLASRSLIIPVQDDGSQLYLEVDDIKIGWSAGDDSMGWLYYYPQEVSIKVLSDRDYESFNLASPSNQSPLNDTQP